MTKAIPLTFSAVCSNGVSEVVPVNGRNLTPSVVHYAPSGEITVGWAAKDMQLTQQERTVHAAKRLMGIQYDRATAETTSKELGLRLERTQDTGNVAIRLRDNRVVLPEEVGQALLQEMKHAAEARLRPWQRMLGLRMREVSVSVPVSFGYEQRLATIRAGKMAGFAAVRLIEEPVAAAMAYGLHKKGDECRSGADSSTNEADRRQRNNDVLVFDIGGGTLDVALLYLDHRSQAFLIQSTAGLPHLGKSWFRSGLGDKVIIYRHAIGGEDFDIRLAEEIAQLMEEGDHGRIVAETEEESIAKSAALVICAELAKRCLSRHENCKLLVLQNSSCVLNKANIDDEISMEILLNRTRFDLIMEELYVQMLKPVDLVLSEGGLSREDTMDVVLVGGSSRIPRIRSLLEQALSRATLHYGLVDPDLAVALGAARSWAC